MSPCGRARGTTGKHEGRGRYPFLRTSPACGRDLDAALGGARRAGAVQASRRRRELAVETEPAVRGGADDHGGTRERQSKTSSSTATASKASAKRSPASESRSCSRLPGGSGSCRAVNLPITYFGWVSVFGILLQRVGSPRPSSSANSLSACRLASIRIDRGETSCPMALLNCEMASRSQVSSS